MYDLNYLAVEVRTASIVFNSVLFRKGNFEANI